MEIVNDNKMSLANEKHKNSEQFNDGETILIVSILLDRNVNALIELYQLRQKKKTYSIFLSSLSSSPRCIENIRLVE
uniref:Uncharacterized protein n=1 Tax=Parascaris equorum TaxID=6256 RepID=A0A914RR61_PAREQ